MTEDAVAAFWQTGRPFVRLYLSKIGSGDVHSSRPHPRRQFHWRVWCAIICTLRNHASLITIPYIVASSNPSPEIHLEIPRCSFHLAQNPRRISCLQKLYALSALVLLLLTSRRRILAFLAWFWRTLHTDAAVPTCSRDCSLCAPSTQPFLRPASFCCCDSCR